MIKERPILFSAEMVRAVLEDRKGQTRRVIKPQPEFGIYAPKKPWHVSAFEVGGSNYTCPYGEPGDRLWIREAWQTVAMSDDLNATQMATLCTDAGYAKPWASIKYQADGAMVNADTLAHLSEKGRQWGRYRHARFMPRWASRIALDIRAVRIERMQDISEADAIAEGVEQHPVTGWWRDYTDRLAPVCRLWHSSPVKSFASLIDSIKGHGTWDSNPWVWVIEFEAVK